MGVGHLPIIYVLQIAKHAEESMIKIVINIDSD
jgi:hypothetical protein